MIVIRSASADAGDTTGTHPTIALVTVNVWARQASEAIDAILTVGAALIIALRKVPFAPNLNVPSTSSRAHGVLVPIPTDPALVIRTTSTGAILVVVLRLANTISP